MCEKNREIDLKVILLGQQNVGKTSLLNYFIKSGKNVSSNYGCTIGAAYASKKVNVDGNIVTLGIWDTAGLEKYNSLTKVYYRNVTAAIICYDVTLPETFDRAKLYIEELLKVEEDSSIYLCGTKNDLIHDNLTMNPSLDVVVAYARNIKAKVFLTSSRTGTNISNIFYTIAKDYNSKPRVCKDYEDFITLTDPKQDSFCLNIC